MATTTLDFPLPQIIPPGHQVVNGKLYMADPKGALVPVEAVKAQDKLMDETVRKVLGYAAPLADEIARFKQHTFDDVDGYVELLRQEYGANPGGRKGNLTLTTFDGLLKVQVAVADHIHFGPELQVAKALVDELLVEWGDGARDELKAIVANAFEVRQQGKVNKAALFSLLKLNIEDERWQRAMKAIRDSMRVVGSKRYVRCYRRADAAAQWEAVSIDVAAA